MNAEGTAKDDVKVPEGDLGKTIQADFDEGKDLLVTIIAAMGEEQVNKISFFVVVPTGLLKKNYAGHFLQRSS